MGSLPKIEHDKPAGRLDILAIRLVDLFVDRRGDLALKAVHARYKPYVDQCLRQFLGPIQIPGLPAPPVASSRPLRQAAGGKMKVEPIRRTRKRKKITTPIEKVAAAAREDSNVIDAEWEDLSA